MENIAQQLEQESPDRVEYAALQKLTQPEEIKRFVADYISLLEEENVRGAAMIASSNIRFLLGLSDLPTKALWEKALKNVA